MTDTVVVEGQVKLRDGKKWKNRWVVLRKPSPVADCLSLLVYKDKGERHKGQRERSSLTLGDICGLETGLSYEGVGYTLAIVSLTQQALLLGFDRRDNLLAWDLRIRHSLGEAHRFNVHVLPGTKLESGPATFHLCNNLLVITRDLPPVVAGQWKLSDLRRYGAVPNGFVFEGGTRCGCWAGVFFLACEEGEHISFLFDCIVRGISPSRNHFGLRPVFSGDNAGRQASPCPSSTSSEERLRKEASDLERRLSRLSVSSRQSSTASTCSYSMSTAGDDCSLSSSSSGASRSDSCLGSRMTLWPEPSPKCPLPTSSFALTSSRASTPASRRTLTPSLSADEQLYAAVMHGPGASIAPTTAGLHLCSSSSSSKLPRPRGLQDAGRQSSMDSGIATTGSYSSYSGSFSSYTGSLDMAAGDTPEELGSLLSLTSSTNLSSMAPGFSPSIPSLAPSLPSHAPSIPSLAPSIPSLAPSIPSLTSVLPSSFVHRVSSQSPCPSPCPSSCSTMSTLTALTPVGPLTSNSEYQVPPTAANDQELPQGHPHHHPLPLSHSYDTPRSLLPFGSHSQGHLEGTAGAVGWPCEGLRTKGCQPESDPLTLEPGSKLTLATAVLPRGSLVPPQTVPPMPGMCSAWKRAKQGQSFDTAYVTREQWLSTDGDACEQGRASVQRGGFPASNLAEGGHDACHSANRETYTSERSLGNQECEERQRYELMGSYTQLQRISRDNRGHLPMNPTFFINPLRLQQQATVCGSHSESFSSRERFPGDGVNYVNIPVSPLSKRQLNYMALDLQELQDPIAAVRGGGTSKYAQIDITAMETAQRVGAEHVLGREERLQELQQRRRGAPS